MKKNVMIIEYCKRLEGCMQEITRISQCSGEIKEEMLSSLEILQSNTGGKILLLFLDESLQFYSRLVPLLLTKEESCKEDQFISERISKIDLYIQTHLTQNVNQKKAADFIGMSTPYFSRYFSKIYQCSFVEYLNRRKIDIAAKLLKDTDMQITDVCYRSGFSSPNQFNRVFKKEKNMTPSEYRRVEN